MSVGLSCAMDLSTDPESGFWSLFFDNSGAQLSSKRTGLSSDHAAGDRQGDHQAAKRDADILWTRNFNSRMLLGISDLEETEEAFSPGVPSSQSSSRNIAKFNLQIEGGK